MDYRRVDLLQPTAVRELLQSVQPDAIYHLAAQSAPSRALSTPWRTLEVNIRAQLNVLEACLSLDMRPRILLVSSGDIYCPPNPDGSALTEDSALHPHNPYALSKVTQDMMGLQYVISHKLPIVRARPFNHTGPGQQEGFVAPDFAMQIARIEAGLQEPVIAVGNLAASRDFTDVRDVVRAYALLMEHGEAGAAYNIASNVTRSIQSLLDHLLSQATTNIEVRIDPDKLRPAPATHIRGDYTRLHERTGWQPGIPFEQTLQDLLDDCRQRVNHVTRSE